MKNKTIDTQIAGIPCRVEITSFYSLRPTGRFTRLRTDPTEEYEYFECEFIVLDHNGYRAEWLENKMAGADQERIEQEILTAYR